MRAVGIKVLKNKLSEYIRMAERGETVLVTDRDRVVAEIVPPETSRSPVLADAMWPKPSARVGLPRPRCTRSARRRVIQ
jgi:prevent-host-death family protein